MAIIGFIALVALGLYFVVAALITVYLHAGFTGKSGLLWLPFLAIGIALLHYAIKHSPFHVSIHP